MYYVKAFYIMKNVSRGERVCSILAIFKRYIKPMCW